MASAVFVCHTADIVPNSGRAALVNGKQVALFRLQTPQGERFFALDNVCPFSKANVLSRGIVGSLKGKWVVASPMYKQHFDLETGICLEDESVSVGCWQVSCQDDRMLVAGKKQIAA